MYVIANLAGWKSSYAKGGQAEFDSQEETWNVFIACIEEICEPVNNLTETHKVLSTGYSIK